MHTKRMKVPKTNYINGHPEKESIKEQEAHLRDLRKRKEKQL